MPVFTNFRPDDKRSFKKCFFNFSGVASM